MTTLTNKPLKLLFSVVASLLLCLAGAISAQAEENPAGATGFTYKINYPENQMDPDLGYYRLKVKPGTEQTLALSLSNPGTEKQTISVKYNSAKTNQNGVIEYGESQLKTDKSMKFDFVEIVKGPEKVELAPGETKELAINVKLPETSYDGVIAGGIQLMREGQGADASQEAGSKVVNQYAYVIGLLLQETDQPVTPDLQLNKIYGTQSNYRNSISVNFSNIMAEYLNDMAVEVQISKKGSDAVLYERKQTAMRMAPNSVIDFPVSMNGEKMVAGNYVGNVLVTSGDQKWTWKEEFTITADEAEKYNERDVSLVQEKGVNWQLIVGVVSGVFVLILVIYFVVQSIRKRKAEQKKAAVKKKKKKTTKKK